MTTFYVCRHGQTENNKLHRLSGWIDTPLTALGVENAHTSARKLSGIHIDRVISSDLGRAFITAYVICQDIGYEQEIERIAELREVNYGDFANMHVSEPDKRYPELSALENGSFTPPDGESLQTMQRRILNCFNLLTQRYPEATLLVVCHDGPIKALRSSFIHEDIGIVDAQSENPHDFVARLTIDSGTVSSFEVLEN